MVNVKLWIRMAQLGQVSLCILCVLKDMYVIFVDGHTIRVLSSWILIKLVYSDILLLDRNDLFLYNCGCMVRSTCIALNEITLILYKNDLVILIIDLPGSAGCLICNQNRTNIKIYSVIQYTDPAYNNTFSHYQRHNLSTGTNIGSRKLIYHICSSYLYLF